MNKYSLPNDLITEGRVVEGVEIIPRWLVVRAAVTAAKTAAVSAATAD